MLDLTRFYKALTFITFLLLWSPVLAQSGAVYSYDALGRLTTVGQSDGSYSSYSYDSAGNRTSKVTLTLGKLMQSWEAEDLPHRVGFTEDDGWAANVSTASDYMTFGPYSPSVPPGDRVGVWRMLIDNNTADDATIVKLEVYDFTARQVLATRVVRRNEFAGSWQYQHFYVPFSMDASRVGHQIELTTLYLFGAHVRVDRVGVSSDAQSGPELGDGWSHSWEAENLPHNTGFAEGDGWAASVNSPPGHMVFGPYVNVAAGSRTAVWRILLDNTTADNRGIVRLDVYDATTNEVIREVTLFRSAFPSAWTYEYFGLPFVVGPERAGHLFEFRTFYMGWSHARVDKIGLK